VQKLVDNLSFQDVYRFCRVGWIFGGLPLLFKPGQGDMDEGTIILMDVLITVDDAAFPGTVGTGKGNITDFAA